MIKGEWTKCRGKVEVLQAEEVELQRSSEEDGGYLLFHGDGRTNNLSFLAKLFLSKPCRNKSRSHLFLLNPDILPEKKHNCKKNPKICSSGTDDIHFQKKNKFFVLD